ncbi:hypothetical protein [Lacrimispora sp.]|uniref:hypothetical protein n=1 Tax=Lacrimispora sp. TaxID=2719234 RepID=UPI0029E6F13E|nr:hypothetical protein [Lacrimispora sp.]
MKNETKNYKFPKPGEDDFYDINEYNGTLDSIDEELMNQEQKKLDTTGDSSQTVTTFEEEVLRENLESGESLSLTHGKIKKWFSEMKNIAFSGRASDIETDGANRFVSDGEKKDWNSKVSADGDISDTKIQSLDSVSAEFPVPEEGETSRQFLGKVRKFIQDFNNFKTGIITVGKLVNNGSTTAGGYALDARYGKTLFDLYNNLNSDLQALSLYSDVSYYVATTGSDTTGDGSQSNPFKTIQHAINEIPKDLGGNMVEIIITDGTYDEDVVVYGYYSGVLTIRSTTPGVLNDNCKIRSISVKDSTYTQLNGITVTRIDDVGITAWNSVLRMFYCQSTVIKPSAAMCYLGESVCDFTGCRCINANIIVRGQNSRIVSTSWTADSTAVNPFFLYGGNTVSETGVQPSGHNFIQGSQVFHENGTQISNLITSGLSCTWGTISGGYIRYGNMTGTAMVTIQISVSLTSVLNIGEHYTINGFPRTLIDTSVSCHAYDILDRCHISTNGSMYARVKGMTAIGNILVFNCTYLTNS